MECYKNLAAQAYTAGRALFPHMPKGHSMEHVFFQLKMDLDLQECAQHFLNPLGHSVQISESFVGRTRGSPAEQLRSKLSHEFSSVLSKHPINIRAKRVSSKLEKIRAALSRAVDDRALVAIAENRNFEFKGCLRWCCWHLYSVVWGMFYIPCACKCETRCWGGHRFNIINIS